MTTDTRVPLVSATGSTRMGRIVGATLPNVLGNLIRIRRKQCYYYYPNCRFKSGGSWSIFGAVGTCGQRCTSTRRLIIHESVYDKVRDAIVGAYGQLTLEILWMKTTILDP